MSAWISAKVYRPGPPPVLTTDALAGFLERVGVLDLLASSDYISIDLKFGSAIDEDEKPIFEADDPTALSTVYRSIKWDASRDRIPLSDVVEWLRSPAIRPARNIYRAAVMLRTLRDEILAEICREESPDFGPMFMDGLDFMVGPEIIGLPSVSTSYMVGWMSVSVGGNGYLDPWTYEEALARVRGCAPLQRLEDLCRECWPVPLMSLSEEQIGMRRSIGRLWTGYDVTAPPDWRWVIQESF